MPKPRLEKEHEDDFAKSANALGYYVLKLILKDLRGWPDRTIFGPDAHIFFIEFKRKGNTLSGPQRFWKKILTRLGFKYYVCFSEGEAMETLQNEIYNHKKR